MQYRREIDGLRAVAVVPVILFHAGFELFGGGFVGVDVFFVISGYLITSLILAELEQGTFSVARFYERRARRILPALILVLLACLPFAYALMLPHQLKDFAASLVSVVFAISNFFFLSQVDYFSPNAELQPLLHTWSLAVEEQYYFLFPPALLLVWRLARLRTVWFVAALVLLSFAFSEWAWRENAQRSFFFTLSRFWEIGAGSLCAFVGLQARGRVNEILSFLGLCLIVAAVFFYTKETPFPSFYTLAPVLGTVLVILFASEVTFVARLLSNAVLVGIGLISYSAYLWHQPIFAFVRLPSVAEPSGQVMAALCLASLVMGWLSWRCVEQPFRRRENPLLATRGRVFAASGAAGALCLVVGLSGYLNDGYEGRFDKRVLNFASGVKDRPSERCYFGASDRLPQHPQAECARPEGVMDAPVMFLGDSHAWALSLAFEEMMETEGIDWYGAFYRGCLPVRETRGFDGGATDHCPEFNEDTISYAKQAGVKTLVLAGRFVLSLKGLRFQNGEGGVEYGSPSWVDVAGYENSRWDDAGREARVLSAYETQLRELAQHFNLVLAYPIPEAGWDVPVYAARRAIDDKGSKALSTSYAAYLERSEDVIALFDRLSSELPQVYAARVHEALCSIETGRCLNADEHGVYYYDNNHPSNAGARLMQPILRKAVVSSLEH